MYAYDYSQDPQFSGLWKKFRKSTRKIRRKIAKNKILNVVLPPTLLFSSKGQKRLGRYVASVGTAVGIKPRFLGIKNAESQRKVKKYAKRVRIAAAVAGVAFGGAALLSAYGPSISGFLAKGGSMSMGGFEWIKGKITTIPSSVSEFLKGTGQDPTTASIGQLLEAGTSLGLLSGNDIQRAAIGAEFTEPYPSSQLSYPQQQQLLRMPIQQAGPVMAGMMPSGIGGLSTNTIMMGMLGVSVIGLMIQSKRN